MWESWSNEDRHSEADEAEVNHKVQHHVLKADFPRAMVEDAVFVAGYSPTSFREVRASRSTRSSGMGLFAGNVMPVLVAFSPAAATSSA